MKMDQVRLKDLPFNQISNKLIFRLFFPATVVDNNKKGCKYPLHLEFDSSFEPNILIKIMFYIQKIYICEYLVFDKNSLDLIRE